jgi:hypothetical protein
MQFDTYLLLQSPVGVVVAENDDVAPGSNVNSRINFTLTQSGNWDVVVESAFPYVTGGYSISVALAGVPTPTPTPQRHGGLPRVVPFRTPKP